MYFNYYIYIAKFSSGSFLCIGIGESGMKG